ncbi:DNA polymerase ligase N-terminal domain-containing protein [Thiohalocapsa sp.]|jgi:DNA ligase D-like protein (predicted 3'-phosphoesterase)|uniref:DNA polymerase ligase N-terminal domain-containing protein n=1 Tax=Thiohalocapsa sp. TaxID=2497641 RepID=UPI0025D59E53|nr:DNA polymerase ligase N-terminal domain-containing protein [Thiohalocapsa sp.]
MVEHDDDKLAAYRGKRDTGKSGEPAGDAETSDSGDGGRFVIQKHDASTLHYDLRLESDGVLKSWAVPKGPSTDPSDKRFAIMTEDHPLDYADFEGVIPEGEYGAGTVLVWDQGRYDNLRAGKQSDPKTMAQSLEEGLVEVYLHGEKLTGGYALKRIEGGNEEKSKWLLIKMRDEGADARRNPTSTEPKSVRSGRDLDAVAAESDDN